MLALFMAGFIGYRWLPVSALPQVDYPTIQVVTLYPGASPDAMAALVTSPLERQFGQMAGLAQMNSTSSGGASRITLQFDLGLPLDIAEQEVRSEEHTSELQSRGHLVCRLLLEKKNNNRHKSPTA